MYKEICRYVCILYVLPKQRSNRLRSQRARENMELRLIGSQVEEAIGDDRQAVLIQQLDLVSNALEALIHYIQSLQVTNLAAQRIMDVGHLLINSRLSLSDGNSTSFKFLTGQIQQIENKEKCRASFLQDLKEHCSKSMTMSKQLRILIEEHKSRKEDFSIAAKNFQNFLNKSKLSSSQLEKLRRQYDTILEDYQESRQILDVRLPKVVNAYVNRNSIIVSINFEVNTVYVISFEKLVVFLKLERCCYGCRRLVTLHEGFARIVEFFNDLDYFKEISEIFKQLKENLYVEDLVKEHNIAVEIPGNVETCQLCQTTNRVDKK
ncbi:uncharacterized protein LOC122633087 isoform X2 [Vespula pensylvanica]|uniref:uncharacterized protein LOC122633087 isoform X2 n=1 Tax=Vespula pensylvanica TaxID=30213 RepID=UPI001CBA4C40|nr:uncharacterized protein LOC122633087 isoform X2 [Vespula pensylvanica]